MRSSVWHYVLLNANSRPPSRPQRGTALSSPWLKPGVFRAGAIKLELKYLCHNRDNGHKCHKCHKCHKQRDTTENCTPKPSTSYNKQPNTSLASISKPTLSVAHCVTSCLANLALIGTSPSAVMHLHLHGSLPTNSAVTMPTYMTKHSASSSPLPQHQPKIEQAAGCSPCR